MFKWIITFLFIFSFHNLFACELESVTSLSSNRHAIYLSKTCTSNNIVQYYENISDQEYKTRFYSNIQTLMLSGATNTVAYSNLADFLKLDFQNSISTNYNNFNTSINVVNLTSTINNSNLNFNSVFGFNFDSSKLGQYYEYIQSNLVHRLAKTNISACCFVFTNLGPETSQQVEDAISKGVGVAKMWQNGSIQKMTGAFINGIKALFLQNGSDPSIDNAIQVQKKELMNELDAIKNQYVALGNFITQKTSDFVVAINSNWNVISYQQNHTAEQVQILENSFEEEKNTIDLLNAQTTTMNNNIEEKLKLSETQTQEYQKGLLVDSQLQNIKTNIQNKLSSQNSQNPLAGVNELNNYLAMANSDENPLRAAQLNNLLKAYVDDRGIISSLSNVDPVISNYQFQTTLNGANKDEAITIRNQINNALALKYNSQDTEIEKKAESAIQLSLSADKSYAKGENKWGERYAESSQEILDYTTNSGSIEFYKAIKLSPAAQQAFGFEKTANSFENFKLIQLANKLANNQNIQENLYLKLYANSLIQQANLESNGTALNSFLQTIHNSFLLLDSVVNGIGNGVTQYVTDTATGIKHLVTHPVDAAETMYNAISNYDQTWSVIRANMANVLQDYPNYTVEQKAAFITKTSLGIASLLLPAGEVAKMASKTGEFANLVNGLDAATRAMVTYAYEGISGLQRADEIAPGYLKYLENGTVNLGNGGALELGNNLANATPEFISGLMNYSQKNELALVEITAISRFKNGFSLLLPKQEYDKFTLNYAGEILGKPPQNQIFATTPAATDELLSIANGNRQIIRDVIGWDDLYFEKSDALVRYEIPFSFTYIPRLPNGSETGVNNLFELGGFTVGYMPEIVIKNVPRSDIIGGYKNGFKIVIPEEN
jgi:hypothetical protein